MPGIDDLKYYELTRARLEHEDGLIVNRLSWLMASQSFLFTAYAIVTNGSASWPSERTREMLHLVPLIGVISTALIYAGVLAAVCAMRWLLTTYRTRIPDEGALGVPPISTPPSIRLWGMAAPLFLPAVFLLAWLVLLR